MTEFRISIGRTFVAALARFRISQMRLVCLAGVAVVSSVLAAFVPAFLGRLVDELTLGLTGASHGSVQAAFAALCGGMLLSVAVRIYYGYEVNRLTNEVGGARAASRNDATYLLSADVPQLNALYGQPLTTVVSDVLDTVFMSVGIGAISISLLGIVAVPLVPIFFVASWTGRRQRNLAVGIRADESASAALMDRALRNGVAVRVFGGVRRELGELRARLDSLRGRLGATNRNLAALMGWVGFLRIAATAIALWVAVSAVARGAIPVGDVAALMMYLTGYYSPAINLSKAYQGIQRGAVSAEVPSGAPSGCARRLGSTTGSQASYLISSAGASETTAPDRSGSAAQEESSTARRRAEPPSR